MADAPGLMPCPFCGGEAILSPARFDLEGYTVNCPRHHAGHTCFVEISLWRKTKSEAITAWNTRATPPAAVVEAMERALRLAAVEKYTDDIGHRWPTVGASASQIALADLTAWRSGELPSGSGRRCHERLGANAANAISASGTVTGSSTKMTHNIYRASNGKQLPRCSCCLESHSFHQYSQV